MPDDPDLVLSEALSLIQTRSRYTSELSLVERNLTSMRLLEDVDLGSDQRRAVVAEADRLKARQVVLCDVLAALLVAHEVLYPRREDR